jgi:hypothetical protein
VKTKRFERPLLTACQERLNLLPLQLDSIWLLIWFLKQQQRALVTLVVISYLPASYSHIDSCESANFGWHRRVFLPPMIQ